LDDDFPTNHQTITFTDLHDASVVGSAVVSDVFFSRRRLTGVVIFRDVTWRADANLYRN
jgi:hypothetical protein